MVLLASKQIALDTLMPNFPALPAVDGKTYSAADFADQEKLVIIFMCFHCPYVQAILPQLKELEAKVQIVAINPNDAERYPDASLGNMAKHAKNECFTSTVFLRDDTQNVAKDFAAVCTPDIFLYDQDRKLIYHGRIEELESALNGEFSGDQIPSQGCSIKWK